MLFFEGAFVVLFAFTTLLCVVLRAPRARVCVLLVASYVFYAAWDWRFLFLIIGSTTLDFFVGRALGTATSRRQLLLTASIVGNLGTLAVFKYLDFGIESFRSLLGVDWPLLELTLPVGISFYTFQSMSYTIDIYRRALAPERNPLRFALFVGFFPQLVAGPIVRASAFLPQMDQALSRFPHRVIEAVPLFVLGLFKKVVLADRFALVVDPVFASPGAYAASDVSLATLAFAAQIYCDFSGYTDMALALAALFGFRLPANFRSPYLATGPQDFWRRWHISLSTWLRDYLYIPLGGSRNGRARTWLALGATMLLGGLWHGAAWTFVCWGAYHGALLIGQRALRDGAPRLADSLAPIGTVLFFPLTLLGWMIFRSDTLAHLGQLLEGLTRTGVSTLPAGWITLGLALVLLEQVASEWSRRRDFRFAEHPYAIFAVAGLGLLLSAVLQPVTRSPFIYFQF